MERKLSSEGKELEPRLGRDGNVRKGERKVHICADRTSIEDKAFYFDQEIFIKKISNVP